MSDFSKTIQDMLSNTGLSRRGFLGGAAALGAMSVTAGGLLVPATAHAADEPKRGGHLKLGLKGGATSDTLDPATYSASVLFVVGRLWGDTLIESDPKTGAALPSIATAWEPSADASVWTFKLRNDVAFHDGTKMTPADIVATLKRHADANSKSGALGLLSSIKTIEEKAGDLVLTLTEGNADLPLVLSDYHLIIQPKGGVDNPAAAIGTGPYKLAKFEPGVRATFEKNPNDWRSDRGYVESVEIIVMNDTTARVAALSSGQVHFVNNIDPKTVPLLKRAPKVEIVRNAGKGFYAFLMHCDTAPFDNNDLRLALKYAIDRQAILDKVLGGYGTLGNDYPVNGNYALAPDDIEQRAYDPEKAAFHFKKSGHDGAVLLRTSEVAFPGAVDAAVLYQESAKKAGIQIEVKREPEDGYWTNVWNAQPFCATYWGGRPTQDSRYSTSYLSTAEWNDTRFKNEAFDKMVVAARAELDETKRRAMYRDMSEMMRDEGGLIAPMFNDFIDGVSANIQGWVDNPAGELMNGDAPLRCWLSA